MPAHRRATCVQQLSLTGLSRPGKLVDEDGERQDDHEEDELGPREHGENNRADRQEVTPPARRGDCVMQAEHRPDEGRVGGSFGQQGTRHHHPRDDDREERDRERPGPGDDLPGEQVRRDRGARHQRGVEDVRCVEGGRHVERAEERSKQQRIELVEDCDERAVDLREGRVCRGDRGRELLVEELVVHQRPVSNPAAEVDREPRTDSAPYNEDPRRCGHARMPPSERRQPCDRLDQETGQLATSFRRDSSRCSGSTFIP